MKPLLIPCILLSYFSPLVCAEEVAPSGAGPDQVDAVEPPAPEEIVAPDGPVGSIGRCRRIAFEGNQAFSTEELRKALSMDISFMLASRPSEPLEKFLQLIAERLHLGYRNSGFPDARVEAHHRAGNEDLPILVSIEEGPRYRQGQIRVRGGQGIDEERLIAALQGEKRNDDDVTMVARIREAMESREDELPEASSVGIDPLVKWGDEEDADWIPGKPVPFQPNEISPLLLDVLYHLAEQGHPLASCETSHRLLPGGLADLMIDIVDLGPEAVVGQVAIDGADKHSEDEIRKLAGLKLGQPVLPRDLDAAMVALWRSGRFCPFTIDSRRRGSGAREIDFHIRLCELKKVPPLSEPVTAEQQCVLKFIDWINRGMDGEDLLLKWKQPGDPDMDVTLGWSGKDGVLIDLRISDTKQGIVASYTDDGFSFLMRDGERKLPARSAMRLGGLKAWFHVLASNDELPMSVGFGAGITSLGSEGPLLQQLGIAVTPAYAYIEKDKIQREGDTVLISDVVKLDLKTGRLLGIADGSVRIAPGCVRARQDELDREIAAMEDADAVALDWWEALSNMVEEDLPQGDFSALMTEVLASSRRPVQLLDLLGKAGAFEALGELVKRGAAASEADTFDIPSDMISFTQGGTGGLLASLGFLWVVEECFPDVDWATTFSRELLLMLGGQTGHTKEVMRGLLADPSIGPLACLVCARILEKFDPASARQFLMKARLQSHPEAFRNDWQMLINSRSLLADHVRQMALTLASFNPEQEAEVAALLPAELEAWLHDFLGTLRQRGDDALLAASISPHMDRLWNDYLGASVEDYLAERLLPAADPKDVAATINGVPVPRFLVRLLRDQQRASLRALPLPEVDDAVPWTRDPALAAAVRLVTVLEHIRQTGGYPPDDVIQPTLNQYFPELVDKDDAEWIRVTGLGRQQVGDWIVALALGETVLKQFGAKVGDPPNEQVLRDHFDRHRALFQSRFSTELIFIKPAGSTPPELTRCHRLASAVAGLADQGVSLETLGELIEDDTAGGCRVFSQTDATADLFQVPVLMVLEQLTPGEMSASMKLGSGIAVVGLKARKEDDSIGYENVRDIVRDHWSAVQAREVAVQWFEAREQGADIQVLEHPEQDSPGRSVFEQLHADQPDSLLGRLGDCWEKLGVGEEAATAAALRDLLAAEREEPDKFVPLLIQLVQIEDRDLALRFLQRAAAADREEAGHLVRQLENTHSKHGENGCVVYVGLKALREQVFGDGDENPAPKEVPAEQQ